MSKTLIAAGIAGCVCVAAAAYWWPKRDSVSATESPGTASGAQSPPPREVGALASEYAALEWPASTPEEIGRVLGHDPGRCLGFVRRALRYEPYDGVLRGSAGTLAAGAGNSADLALVLRDMLRGGIAESDLRFALATLSADQANGIVTRAMRAAPPETAWASTRPAPAETASAPPTDSERAALQSERKDFSRVVTGIKEHHRALEPVLPAAGYREDGEGARSAARHHVWLQVRQGGSWMALDPVLGDTSLIPESTVDELPPAVAQRIAVSIEIEREERGRLLRAPILEADWPTEIFATRPLQIVVVPDGVKLAGQGPHAPLVDRVRSWQRFRAAMSVPGERAHLSDAFDLTGRRAASGPLTIDVFGRARGIAGGASAERLSSLTGLALTIRLTSPGAPAIAIERWLVDRIGPVARAAGAPAVRPALASSTAVALALLQRLEVLFPSGRISAVALARDALAPLAASSLLDQVAELRRGTDVSVETLTLPSLPADLIQISNTALAQTDARIVGRGRVFHPRPNVLIHTDGFVFDGTNARSRAGIDIARGELAALADPAVAVEAKRWYGLLISELEGPALASASPGNQLSSAAETLRQAVQSGATLAVVATPADLEQVPVDADTRMLMTADLREGYRLVAPNRAVKGLPAAWWRIDPGGGLLAIGSEGRGQAGSEGMMVLTDISIPSVERTMKFTACFNEAIAGGRSTSSAGGACLAQAIVDIVKSSLDAAIDSFIKNPLNEAMDDARAGMLGDEYDELYQKAQDAWEKFQQAQALLDDPIGETIEKIPGVQEGQAAADAGRRVGSAFGFRLYLMMTMGKDIAAYAAKR